MHLRGVGALIHSRPDDGEPISELTRTLVYFKWLCSFVDPVLLNQPSPYEQKLWIELSPPIVYAVDKDSASLRRSSHRLFIRLPRLIAAVRKLRNGDTDMASYQEAVELARDLLSLNDLDTESALLHRVSICKTAGVDSLVIPCSFQFPNCQSHEAALYFWTTRIILHRLALQLCALNLPTFRPTSIFSSELSAQNLRYAANILIALHYARTTGRMSTFRMFFPGLALWSVTCDCGVLLRNTATSLIRPMILRAYHELVRKSYGPQTLCAEDLDEAAELLRGGPIVGLLVGMFT